MKSLDEETVIASVREATFALQATIENDFFEIERRIRNWLESVDPYGVMELLRSRVPYCVANPHKGPLPDSDWKENGRWRSLSYKERDVPFADKNTEAWDMDSQRWYRVTTKTPLPYVLYRVPVAGKRKTSRKTKLFELQAIGSLLDEHGIAHADGEETAARVKAALVDRKNLSKLVSEILNLIETRFKVSPLSPDAIARELEVLFEKAEEDRIKVTDLSKDLSAIAVCLTQAKVPQRALSEDLSIVERVRVLCNVFDNISQDLLNRLNEISMLKNQIRGLEQQGGVKSHSRDDAEEIGKLMESLIDGDISDAEHHLRRWKELRLSRSKNPPVNG